MPRHMLLLPLLLGVVLLAGQSSFTSRADEKKVKDDPDAEWALPDERLMIPFKDDQPIVFVNRNANAAEWESLKAFWTPATQKAVDPVSGKEIERKIVKIKLPLGLNTNPVVPVENPITVAKWKLGKRLYYDDILSSDKTVSCATCHDPKKGFTDQLPVSSGIAGKKGGMSAPTVINSAYNGLQFWDGRATSLEDQAQGPVQNAVEMFSGKGHAWNDAIRRIRADKDYVAAFKAVFGTPPTRDGVAKAIATYERTVFSGNSIHDRADLAMRKRVEAEETGKYVLLAKDYAKVLKEAFAAKDTVALKALKLDPAKDVKKADDVAKSLVNGRNVYFGKARCNGCHVGDNFTDNAFHNLGVALKDGKIPRSLLGRFGALPTGHKNPETVSAFKTPTLRALLSTAPYMHDGSEKTLEAVVDFYDKGGNPNPYLDIRMRDEEAEKEWLKTNGKGYKGPKAYVYNGKPIVPLALKLTPQEKKDLVMFLRALQGDAIDPVVADPAKMIK